MYSSIVYNSFQLQTLFVTRIHYMTSYTFTYYTSVAQRVKSGFGFLKLVSACKYLAIDKCTRFVVQCVLWISLYERSRVRDERHLLHVITLCTIYIYHMFYYYIYYMYIDGVSFGWCLYADEECAFACHDVSCVRA